MSTANRDSEIRSVIASATARYIEELASSQALRAIDLEHQLTIEILEACGKRIQKVMEDLSAAHKLQNQQKDVIHKLEEDRDFTATKLRVIFEQLKSTSKCRNCKKDFGCYIAENPSPFGRGSVYMIRCEGCQCRHQ
ncbi:speckle-type POZ [Fusarium circinatum]|uniref:Speckle-type POZ n=1 Tax=Fusarium circinatum TaxID=48490 RepID=A0A8H5T2P2_FUSCI|nr:speckle-type POZ [Fusarium circinatum]